MQIICISVLRDNHARPSSLSFLYRPDAFPDAQPTVSEHWGQYRTRFTYLLMLYYVNTQIILGLLSPLLCMVIEVESLLHRVYLWRLWRLDTGFCLTRSTWHLRRHWSVWVVCWKVPVDQLFLLTEGESVTWATKAYACICQLRKYLLSYYFIIIITMSYRCRRRCRPFCNCRWCLCLPARQCVSAPCASDDCFFSVKLLNSFLLTYGLTLTICLL